MFNVGDTVKCRQSHPGLTTDNNYQVKDCKEGEVYVINDDGDLDYFAPYVFELVSSRQDDEMYILLGKMLESDNVPDHLPSWIAGYKAGRLKIGT
jgi:hypothetical protein